MATHNDLGKEGESIAEHYFLAKKYNVLAKNYRYKKAEIDLIILKNNVLAFVEVKTRSSAVFQNPEQAVSVKKQKLIIQAANQFILDNIFDEKIEFRFDIVSVLKQKNETKIQHIKEAFYPVL